MAAGNFGSPVQLLILLAIVVLLFGGKRLRNLGGDLGNAIKGFKTSMASSETEQERSAEKINQDAKPVHIIEGKVELAEAQRK